MGKRSLVVIVAAVMLCMGAVSASAQLRLDMDVNVPAYIGISSAGTTEGIWNQFFIPFPDARLAYQFGSGAFRAGVGVRVFTFIIENILYPEAYVEYTVDRFAFSANVGGFGFLEFGLLSGVLQSTLGSGFTLTGFHDIVIPDLNVAYKVNDWFRIGAGIFMLAPFTANNGALLSDFIFTGYINARFVVMFK
jgi:hypothetical protein